MNELAELITNAGVWNGTSDEDDWPEPSAIATPLLPVPPFDANLLPASLRPWVMDIANRMQCPPDFPAVGAMIALATTVGRSVVVRPKQLDDWTVVPNLWGMVVGRPSALKSPAISETLKPLHRIEEACREKHEIKMRQYEKTKLVHGVRLEAFKTKAKKAAMAGQDIGDDAPELVAPPPRRRLVSMDTTVEKLGELLRDNERGVLVYRDEIAGWFATFDREGRESDRAFYLEAWNGNAPFRYDRIGRGTIDIKAACVSMLGTIQPGVLCRHVAEQVKGASNDGLAQRFQLMVYPDDSTAWTYVDATPNGDAKRRANDVMQKLDETDALQFGAQLDPDDDSGRVLRFDDAAQGRFKRWLETLERKLRDPDEHAIVSEHLGKFRSLMPSLAALIHLANVAAGLTPPGPIVETAAVAAIAWCDYLEAHARRIYGSALSRNASAARLLASKIRKRKLGERFKARDVYVNEWSGLASADEVKKALDVLEDLSWVRSETTKTGGRPTVEYLINPKVFAPTIEEDDES